MVPDLIYDDDSLVISVDYQVCSGSGSATFGYNLTYGTGQSQTGISSILVSDLKKIPVSNLLLYNTVNNIYNRCVELVKLLKIILIFLSWDKFQHYMSLNIV